MHLYLEDVFLYQLVEVLAGFIPQGDHVPALGSTTTPTIPEPATTPAGLGEGILDVVQGSGGVIVPDEVEILMRELYHPHLVETFNIGPVDIGM